MKKVLFVSYKPAMGTIWINETFRTTFGMYGEDIEPAILLMDDSVIGLNKDYAPEKMGFLPIKTVHRYIKRYETEIYAVKEDIEERKVEIGEDWNIKLISKEDLSDFVHEFDFVIFM
ncbi:MAG: intracellular sulfur oxidation protein [Thermoplasmata archaeon]|nr:intracellular sulfur oxidation protein [Thermoplasmata archaeon]